MSCLEPYVFHENVVFGFTDQWLWNL